MASCTEKLQLLHSRPLSSNENQNINSNSHVAITTTINQSMLDVPSITTVSDVYLSPLSPQTVISGSSSFSLASSNSVSSLPLPTQPPVSDSNSTVITSNNTLPPLPKTPEQLPLISQFSSGHMLNNNLLGEHYAPPVPPSPMLLSTKYNKLNYEQVAPIVYTSISTGSSSRHRHRRHSHANASSISGSSQKANTLNPIAAVNNRVEQYLQHVHRSFVIKPIPSANLRPLLVFINPKSGGNQGTKLMQKFQWHLNPRQVFDLSQGGPRLGLDLYKKVHNLRILACGGDGTAGWVLSAIDEIAIQPPPPISVLPLGTGNDLARAFGWGGSYTDEPIAKILCNIQNGQVVQLDRWNLKVQPNMEVQIYPPISSYESKGAKSNLPLNVVNNYFSFGVDAHIALSFHEAREAHPERFNSRLRNRMFYGQAGGKDLLQRKWKDLCNYVHLECDGKDYTGRLKELKVHSVLFLNISR